ncbi:hypothetical protein PO124_07845 [Bacillus licheniformis]|nr:hypothetical protein [Bacillus licheniformis]
MYDTDITGLDHPQRSNPQFTIMAKTSRGNRAPLLKERIEQYLPHGIAFWQTARCGFCPQKGALLGDETYFDSGNNSGWPHGSSALNRKRCLSNMMLNWLTAILCRKAVIFASSV